MPILIRKRIVGAELRALRGPAGLLERPSLTQGADPVP